MKTQNNFSHAGECSGAVLQPSPGDLLAAPCSDDAGGASLPELRHSGRRFLVRVNGLAVRFQLSLEAKSIYEAVADAEATTFGSVMEAVDMAVAWRIVPGKFAISKVSEGAHI